MDSSSDQLSNDRESTCAISVIRVKFLKQGGDQTYENIEGSSWSITELCSGVVCACLPTLRPLVSKCAPALSRRLHKSSEGYQIYSDTAPSDIEKHRRYTRNNSIATDYQPTIDSRTSPSQPVSPALHGNSGLVRTSGSRHGTSSGSYELDTLPPRGADAHSFPRAFGIQDVCPGVGTQVTTEIGPSHSPPPKTAQGSQYPGIHVKHVVVVSRGGSVQ